MNSSVVLHGEEMDFLSAVYGVSRVSWKLLFDFISQPGWLGELRAEQAARILQRTGEMLHRRCTGSSREFPARTEQRAHLAGLSLSERRILFCTAQADTVCSIFWPGCSRPPQLWHTASRPVQQQQQLCRQLQRTAAWGCVLRDTSDRLCRKGFAGTAAASTF